MNQCSKKVANDSVRVEELRKYLHTAPQLDYNNYWDLIEHKLSDFMPADTIPEEQRSIPVQLTQEERQVQLLVEEITEELKAEAE